MEKQEILNNIKDLNKIPKTAKIAVIMGGLSDEREISLLSGKNCLNALLEQGYINTYALDMGRDISATLSNRVPDIAFIILHGAYGEDGYIQNILENLNIPYTGSNSETSEICIDKEETKEILRKFKIPCPKTIYALNEGISFPVFCKPKDSGSSLGAGIAKYKNELDILIKEINTFSDKKPLIEEFIKGKELTVGVLQLEDYIFSTDILEIEVKNGEYDYKNKYTQGALIYTSPAQIGIELTELIKNYAIRSFKSVNCRGFARVDIILQGNTPYIIEINTIPGMTNQSDLPYQANTFGIDYKSLVNIMLHSSLIKQIPQKPNISNSLTPTSPSQSYT